MCLGVILSTLHRYAKIPEGYLEIPTPSRENAPSLMEAAVSVIWKKNVPWRDYEDSLGENCKKALMRSGFYQITPTPRSKSNRYANTDTKEKIYLGSGTIVVCPPNLVEQWRSEIAKHVDGGLLKVLILASSTAPIPPVQELLKYDIVLFSRTRFDQEEKEGRDFAGRRESGGTPLKCSCPYIGSTRTTNCLCFNKDDVYRSPLMSIHWLRLIVDEGHFMGSGRSNGVCVAERLRVDARWIVSGTPSPSLMGIVSPDTEGETKEEVYDRQTRLLNDKKEFQFKEKEDLERLGRIVRDFLHLKPWASSKERDISARGVQASWSSYITKGFADRRAGSTTCVQNILHRLMIRHRAEDIEDRKSVV